MLIRLPRKERFKVREAAQALDKHTSTLFRWNLRGVRGHRLRMVLIGGQRYVLRRDLIAFLRAINDEAAAPPAARRSTNREDEIARAEAELTEAGIIVESHANVGDDSRADRDCRDVVNP